MFRKSAENNHKFLRSIAISAEFARKEQEEDRERRSDPEAISFDEYCLQNGLPLGTTPAEIAMLRKNL